MPSKFKCKIKLARRTSVLNYSIERKKPKHKVLLDFIYHNKNIKLHYNLNSIIITIQSYLLAKLKTITLLIIIL